MAKWPKVDAELVDCRDRQAWLAERIKSVGGSESPAIMGQSGDMANAVSVWADKVNPALFSAMSERQQWGLELEGPIAEAYMRKYGGTVNRWPQTLLARSVDNPLLHCTPDGIVYDAEREGPGDFSIKTWSEFDRKAWATEPPLYVQIQSQHAMYVNRLQWGVVAVLFGNSTLERFYVERNDRFIEALKASVEEFWGYVVDRVPPPIDGGEATTRALARLHPDDNGLAIALPPDADALVTALDHFDDVHKESSAVVDGIRNQLRAWIGDATYGVTASGRWVSWKSQTRPAYTAPETTFRVLRECKAPKGVQLPTEIDYKVAERRRLPSQLKERMLRDDPHCRWCGCTLTLATATYEHIVPLAVGGTNARSNITIACASCNNKRGSQAALTVETK